MQRVDEYEQTLWQTCCVQRVLQRSRRSMLKKRNERQKSDCVRSQKKGYGSAVCKGYCRGHADQCSKNETNDRKAIAYAVKKKDTDPILKTLQSIGSHITPVNEYMVSKCDPMF
ncbi:hypothetical protein PBCV1_a433R [Paramecium bursaria Chlorella virus 1]|uniref:Uncharacterized protein n=1 Tax=Paramecium bursaria Chlorella virus 1 TaxID=10506 RepID=Q98484_PBCV1|nr:hypothetical protein PBCV1_a433R [Paramecium bursaria Chlorella virus 1]AAC96801.2 hypothetical protein [Paramecium bursaria Chlorella virus 1]